MELKRLALAVALAFAAAPLIAGNGAPFEQTELDRTLNDVPETRAAYESIDKSRMPFEQTELDRVLPEVPGGGERVMVASIGDTVYVSAEESDGASPWTSDHNFIAPAQ